MRENKKRRIAETKAIAERECWELDSLRDIVDPSSYLYKTAVNLRGISNELVRSFRNNLKDFKKIYR